MDYNKRNKDLTEVFEQRYQANKYDNIKKAKQEQNVFTFRMFGIKDKDTSRKELRESYSIESKVNNLNNKIKQQNN